MFFHDAKRQFCLVLLALILTGALALPMVPAWEAAIRLLALTVLYRYAPIRYRFAIAATGGAALLVYVAGWGVAFLASPLRVLIDTVVDVYGVAVGTLPNAVLFVADAAMAAGLFFCLLKRDEHPSIILMSARLLAGFAVWTVLSTTVSIVHAAAPAPQLLAGASTWLVWVITALLVFVLCRSHDAVMRLMNGLIAGGAIVGLITLLQMVMHDYSYVLDSLWFDEYYMRVRSTYYYYTPAMLAVALAGVLMLARAHAYPSRTVFWYLFGVALLAIAIFNGSRGLALASTAGLSVTALFLMAWKKWRYGVAVAVLAVAPLFLAAENKPSVSGDISVQQQQEACANSLSLGKAMSTGSYDPDSYPLPKDASPQHAGRNWLLTISLRQLPHKPLWGNGIGDAKIPLGGDQFNGIQQTYSSHTLYLDIALMAGIPALLFMLAYFANAGLFAAWTLCSKQRTIDAQRSTLALLVATAMFGIMWCFLGQEQDQLRLIGFVLAAMLIVSSAAPKTTATSTATSGRLPRIGTILLLCAAVFWAVFTSASYTLPAAEFVGRYWHELKRSPHPVYTNSSILQHSLKLAFGATGITAPVTILPDDAKKLPTTPYWILWSEAHERNYPNLRCTFGYQTIYKNMRAPSVAFPAAWWMLHNKQNTVSFIYTGLRDLKEADETIATNVTDNLAKEALAKSNPPDFHHAVDLNLGTYMAISAKPTHFIFNLPDDTDLVAYRLFPHQDTHDSPAQFYSWKIERSHDQKHWRTIEQHSKFPLHDFIFKGKFFTLPTSSTGTFIRISVHAPGLQPGQIAGIAEIELYTRPKQALKE